MENKLYCCQIGCFHLAIMQGHRRLMEKELQKIWERDLSEGSWRRVSPASSVLGPAGAPATQRTPCWRRFLWFSSFFSFCSPAALFVRRLYLNL